jgi:hypothetical protein
VSGDLFALCAQVHRHLDGTRIASNYHRTQPRHSSVTERRSRSRLMQAKGVLMGRKKQSFEQKWHEQAEAFRREAEKLPYGREREELLRKARQLETASHINEWVSSPGLSSPT